MIRKLIPLENAIPISELKHRKKEHDNQSQENLYAESLENDKRKKTYKNYMSMIDKLCSTLKTQKLQHTDVNLILSKKSIKVNTIDLVDAIFECCVIAKIVDNDEINGQLFIENPDDSMLISNFGFVEKILSDIVSRSKKQTSQINVGIEIEDITKTASKIISHLKNRSDVRLIKKLPNNYLVTKNKVVVDLITHNLFSIEDIRLSYDVTNLTNVQFIDYNDQSPEMRQSSLLNQQIISRVMKDWSNHNDEIEYLLWQIAYSVLQNDNHGRFFVIKGPGGNGKSTFMELLASIAGLKNVIRANIHQFGDPNSINDISLSTKLIIGDDAATNHKISDTALSNLKSITTGQSISLPVKYEKNRIIKTNAVFIQGTNTDISFFENNRALKGRAVVIDWTPTDFRSQKPSDITFNLDSLMENQDFLDEFFMMCITKVQYFSSFKIPEIVSDSTDQMIESNDSIKLFLDDTLELFKHYPIVPLKLVYQEYINWNKDNNPSSGVMKMQTFVKALKEKESEFNFSRTEDRTTFRSMFYKNAILHDFNSTNEQLAQRQFGLIFDDAITEEEIDNFINNENHPIQDLTDRQLKIANICVYDKNQQYIKSLYDL